MLIVVVLGALVALVAVSAIRFARMEDTKEQEVFAARQRKRVIFSGPLTARAAKEAIPEELLQGYAGERVKITVERLKQDDSH